MQAQTSKHLFKTIQEAYRMDENLCLEPLLKAAKLPSASQENIARESRSLVQALRKDRLSKAGLDAFLTQYDLSSEEGIALMCLAEALLRIPDASTADKLIKDKIADQNWEQYLGKSQSWFVNAATWGLMLTGKLLNHEKASSANLLLVFKRLAARTGEPIIRNAVRQAMKILGRQFVMAESIEDALIRAKEMEAQGYRYSYDMLGEAAKTKEDAAYYLESYRHAIDIIGQANQDRGPIDGPGVSVKLSALHPRYEWNQRDRMQKELLPILKSLVLQAKEANIGFTIDAEEAERLELSLLLFEALLQEVDLGSWQGLGLAVQSYQKRAFYVIDWLAALAKQHHRCFMVRLVKGAYWDSEIKWTQERGLKDYPVFTRKSSTDVAFLACAQKLLKAGSVFYPQFASHNAHSVASVKEMARLLGREGDKAQYEFQCLHGMGESLYNNIIGKDQWNIPCRVYAPVGGHEHLLGYLVRRLLENGANTSFVNRIIDEKTPVELLIQDPVLKTERLSEKRHPKIPLPQDLYRVAVSKTNPNANANANANAEDSNSRPNSRGLDLSDSLEMAPLLQAISKEFPKIAKTNVHLVAASDLPAVFSTAKQEADAWTKTPIEERARCLERLAYLLDENRAALMAIVIREGGRTVMDANSELREAIDFCWYYRERLIQDFPVQDLKGPAGESNQLSLHGRGIVVCISPWNFPLAIFLGQILAALAAGNVAISKPASQTPKIALAATALLHEAGFPKTVLQCVIGSGSSIGNALLEAKGLSTVMLTGSTETARVINQTLAKREGPIVSLIAETGGQNVMIVDSSALAEQVISDVLVSAFNSAGQRCSALRVLYVQEEVADSMIKMLKGAMQELKIGDPFDLSTDVGPVIDQKAAESLRIHVEFLKKSPQAKLIYECALPDPKDLPNLAPHVFFAPIAFEIDSIKLLTQEVFGPVLHVVRYQSSELNKVIQDINNTGFGLTMGIHSRIYEVVELIHRHARVGNTYVNRNMIGAVVGVQPFGGEGLSGTGPKAGGPHMLPRLALERTLSINTAAAGGNVALMSLDE